MLAVRNSLTLGTAELTVLTVSEENLKKRFLYQSAPSTGRDGFEESCLRPVHSTPQPTNTQPLSPSDPTRKYGDSPRLVRQLPSVASHGMLALLASHSCSTSVAALVLIIAALVLQH